MDQSEHSIENIDQSEHSVATQLTNHNSPEDGGRGAHHVGADPDLAGLLSQRPLSRHIVDNGEWHHKQGNLTTTISNYFRLDSNFY